MEIQVSKPLFPVGIIYVPSLFAVGAVGASCLLRRLGRSIDPLVVSRASTRHMDERRRATRRADGARGSLPNVAELKKTPINRARERAMAERRKSPSLFSAYPPPRQNNVDLIDRLVGL